MKIIVTFDLENAEDKDYDKINDILEKIGETVKTARTAYIVKVKCDLATKGILKYKEFVEKSKLCAQDKRKKIKSEIEVFFDDRKNSSNSKKVKLKNLYVGIVIGSSYSKYKN